MTIKSSCMYAVTFRCIIILNDINKNYFIEIEVTKEKAPKPKRGEFLNI